MLAGGLRRLLRGRAQQKAVLVAFVAGRNDGLCRCWLELAFLSHLLVLMRAREGMIGGLWRD